MTHNCNDRCKSETCKRVTTAINGDHMSNVSVALGIL